MTDLTPEQQAAAKFMELVGDKLTGDELTRVYVESIAKSVASEVVDSRLKPFYRHPTFTNITTLVASGLVFIGISSFWGDLIRKPIQNFLHIDRSVAEAVQNRQYELFMGGFQLGSTATIATAENDACNSLRGTFLTSSDILIPKTAMQSFVPTCMRLNRNFTAAEDLSFIAEPKEKLFLEVLLIARETPTITNGFDGEFLSLKKLSEAVAKGGNIIGRSASSPIVARIDREEIKLIAKDSMVSVRDPSSNEIHDYQSFWAWYKLPENSGQFHNLSVALPKNTDGEKYSNNLIVRVFLERNKVTGNFDDEDGEEIGG